MSGSSSSGGGMAAALRSFVGGLRPAQALALGLALSATSTLLLTAARRAIANKIAERHAEEQEGETSDEPPPLEPATAAATSSRRSASAASSKAVVSRPSSEWSESEFKAEATSFLEMLGSSGVLSPAREANLRAALPAALSWSHDSRALGAHFLLASNAHHLTESNTEEEFMQLMARQATDMRQAWELLSCVPPSESDVRALDVMRLQVAQCIKDLSLILPVFERMMSRPVAELSDDELILLFTTAPLLGRWSATVALGDHLASKHDLSDFHNAPMDYQVLYELAKGERALTRQDAPVQQLKWINFRIHAQRLRLVRAECAEPSVIEALEAEFAPDGARAWKEVGVSEETRMVRCGALCQLRSFSPVPLALVGPASDDQLYVRGYAVLPHMPTKQTETYDLRRVSRSEFGDGNGSGDDVPADVPADAHYWKGEYVMQQEAVEGAVGIPTLSVTFDLEMIVVPLPAI